MSLPLLAEMKRRRVFRALIGYGVAAFAVLQVIEPIVHGLHWPDAVLGYVVVGLAIGFPVVVGLAWIFDVNAGAIERTPPAASLGGMRLPLLLAGIGLLAAAPGLTWYFLWHGRERPGPQASRAPSIAVLPFVNLNGDKENEPFSDGITEEIINALANVEGIHVVARTSAFSFKGKNANVRQIGAELNVATVLEGSVRREGSQLRIAAQLVGTEDGYHLWSKTYDRELRSIFAVEDELARAIVQALLPKLVRGHSLVQPSTASPEAHDLYLQGRYLWSQRSIEGLTKARTFFERAIALDPRYALAHSGLADCNILLVDYGGARLPEVLPKARAHALEAVRLDDSLAETHASLGAVSEHDYDWNTAERELKRAIELRPAYATAHQWYAEVLLARARLPEARAEAERARQYDPASPVVNHVLALTFMGSRDYERSIEHQLKTLELDRTFGPARAILVAAFLQSGRIAEAEAVLDGPDAIPGRPFLRVQLLVAKGERTAAQRLLAESREPGTAAFRFRGPVAAAYLAVGDKEEAIAWLERGVEEKDPILALFLKSSQRWDPIRSDPRFQRLLQRMNVE